MQKRATLLWTKACSNLVVLLLELFDPSDPSSASSSVLAGAVVAVVHPHLN
jgi:hypothetical protein